MKQLLDKTIPAQDRLRDEIEIICDTLKSDVTLSVPQDLLEAMNDILNPLTTTESFIVVKEEISSRIYVDDECINFYLTGGIIKELYHSSVPNTLLGGWLAQTHLSLLVFSPYRKVLDTGEFFSCTRQDDDSVFAGLGYRYQKDSDTTVEEKTKVVYELVLAFSLVQQLLTHLKNGLSQEEFYKFVEDSVLRIEDNHLIVDSTDARPS